VVALSVRCARASEKEDERKVKYFFVRKNRQKECDMRDDVNM